MQDVAATVTDVFGTEASAQIAIPTPTFTFGVDHRGFDYRQWFGGEFRAGAIVVHRRSAI